MAKATAYSIIPVFDKKSTSITIELRKLKLMIGKLVFLLYQLL